MITGSEIYGEFGTLTVETEAIEVTSNLPRINKAWTYTDRAGHQHYWRDGYLTLVDVVDETYWDDDLDDEVTVTHSECPLCHEHIRPGTVGPSGFREFAPGRKSYYLDGEPISEEHAKQIIEAWRRP